MINNHGKQIIDSRVIVTAFPSRLENSCKASARRVCSVSCRDSLASNDGLKHECKISLWWPTFYVCLRLSSEMLLLVFGALWFTLVSLQVPWFGPWASGGAGRYGLRHSIRIHVGSRLRCMLLRCPLNYHGDYNDTKLFASRCLDSRSVIASLIGPCV